MEKDNNVIKITPANSLYTSKKVKDLSDLLMKADDVSMIWAEKSNDFRNRYYNFYNVVVKLGDRSHLHEICLDELPQVEKFTDMCLSSSYDTTYTPAFIDYYDKYKNPYEEKEDESGREKTRKLHEKYQEMLRLILYIRLNGDAYMGYTNELAVAMFYSYMQSSKKYGSSIINGFFVEGWTIDFIDKFIQDETDSLKYYYKAFGNEDMTDCKIYELVGKCVSYLIENLDIEAWSDFNERVN